MSEIPEPPFASYQHEVYLQGLLGDGLELPLDLTALEAVAEDRLRDEVYDYVAGGAGTEATMGANRRALDRWELRARHLGRDVSERDLTVELFGQRLPSPVLLAPIGVLGSVHPGGELAVARAAAEVGVPWIVPTLSSASLEDVAEAMGDTPRWFQLYWQDDPAVTESFVGRAEAAGYAAVVLTIDTQLPAWRPRDLQYGYHPLLGGEGVANYTADPAFTARLDLDADEQAIMFEAAAMLGDPTRTWEHVAALCEATRLPVVVKGVQHPDDAEEALAAGVAGIGVSNHGGRQLDGAVGSADALPAVAEVVAGAVPILFDSGIRSGADVVKALALGADAVLVGRPYVWGLGAGGQAGVEQVLRALLAETDLSLGLTGHTSASDLDRTVFAPPRGA